MQHPIEDRLLARYLAGDTSPDETRRVQQALRFDPAIRRRLEGVRIPGEEAHRGDPERAVERLRLRMEAAAPPEQHVSAPDGGRRIVLYRLMRIAAAVAALALAVILIQRFTGTPSSSEDTARFIAGTGERLDVSLPDGSTVTLAPRSELRVREPWETRREVSLSGEAFFEVAGDAHRPFSVLTENGRIEVIGTAFNVRADLVDAVLSVAVRNGTVTLHAPEAGQSRNVRDGQMGRIDPDGHIIVEDVDAASAFAWLEGRLVYEGATIARVANDLERWRGVAVSFRDAGIGRLRLDASFSDEPVEEIARLIALALDLKYRIEGDTLTFEFRRPPSDTNEEEVRN